MEEKDGETTNCNIIQIEVIMHMFMMVFFTSEQKKNITMEIIIHLPEWLPKVNLISNMVMLKQILLYQEEMEFGLLFGCLETI